MGVFSFFKKSKVELTDEQKKWNKMWDLWVEGRADSPYSELMTYQSEINNGGHDQYFFNIEMCIRDRRSAPPASYRRAGRPHHCGFRPEPHSSSVRPAW